MRRRRRSDGRRESGGAGVASAVRSGAVFSGINLGLSGQESSLACFLLLVLVPPLLVPSCLITTCVYYMYNQYIYI